MNKYEFLFYGETVNTSFKKVGERFKVTAGDKEFILQPIGENQYKINVDGKLYHAAVVYNKGTFYIDIDSVLLEIKEPLDEEFAGDVGGHAAEKDKIYAPMPGKIVKILVNVGDKVEEKHPMVIVEAMKMENQVNSKARGKVMAVNYAVGDQVDIESPIIELELEG